LTKMDSSSSVSSVKTFGTFPSKEVICLKGHQGSVHTVKFNTDGNYCLSGGSDRSIKLWNPHNGKLIKTYLGHGWEVADICVSMDNSKIVRILSIIDAFFS